jgi:long-chain acyl-CoA synthetase
VLAAADPVAAFLDAHDAGVPVALRTSGTSGARRAVVRTTGSWVSSFPAVARLTGLTSSSRLWVPGPQAATMNLFAAVHAAHLSATLVDHPEDATHAHLTPTVLARCLEDGTPVAGLRVVVAGDRLSPALHERAVDAGAEVHHYYGAAELSFAAWGSHAADLRSFPGVEVSVRDGEIGVRSPYLCLGYDGPPGALRVDADGWATVGDRGALVDGVLSVHGRAGSVSVGGATVAPAEVEALLRAAATGDVAVVGLPHPTLGSVLAVALCRVEDHPALHELARTALAGGHRPRLWFHLDALPTTAVGKPDPAALVALLSGPGSRARRLV